MRRLRSATAVSLSLVGWATYGSEVRAAIGGPDAAGYVYFDQVDGAPYQYVDIAPTGTLVASGDDVIVDVALGAPFTFYGQTVNQLSASTNGFLSDQLADADGVNACPVPSVVQGGGFRVATLHDDLVGDVYYEYFDEAEAELVGFPNAQGGISVFQWVGQHVVGAQACDVEVVLFHGTGAIQMQYLQGGDAGSSSTIGIQNAAATIGLEYACNQMGAVVGGVTAVRFASFPLGIQINEIRVDQSGVDNDEAVELVGPPGAVLDGLSYVVLGDAGVGTTGVVESVTDLTGHVIPPSGFFVFAEPTYTQGTPDLTVAANGLNFESPDTVTHMLVADFSGALNDNLDPDNDGVLNTVPWSGTEDVVALANLLSTELPYGPGVSCVAGPDCILFDAGFGPSQVFRCEDGTGSYSTGNFNLALLPATDSPGAANPCVCGDGVLIFSEACDDDGESAICDSDCTAPLCGDALVNASAGEVCDDGGESATCDGDCTSVACGDGLANASASEDCDDGAESAACDADCSLAICGDGTTNATAGEDCDDDGESPTCDLDCTAASCGDGLTNSTAGETCDDGGRSAACNADCTAASCGDGMLNAAAGEQCDDGNESAACNADCTTSMCGDGVLNATAGEQCDDSNTDDGDGCSSTCSDEAPASSSSGGSSDSSSGSGSGGSSGGSSDGSSDGSSGSSADSSSGAGSSDSEGSGVSGTSDSGASSTADTGGTGGGTMADSSGGASDSLTATGFSDSLLTATDESGDGGLSGGASSDDGCSCASGGDEDVPWGGVALLGVAALRRRRRRPQTP